MSRLATRTLVAVLSIPWTLTWLPAGCPPPPPADDNVILSRQTVVVEQSTAIHVQEVASDTLVLSPGSQVAVGQILAGSGSGGPFLRKVVATQVQLDGTVRVTTEQASLDEAVQVGSVTHRQKVSFAPGASTGKAMRGAKAIEGQGYTLLDRTDISVSLSKVTLEFDPDVDLELKYNGGLEKFRAVLIGNLNVDLETGITIRQPIGALEYERQLAEIPGTPIYFWMGGLLIEVLPVLQVIGGVEVSAPATGSVTYTGGVTLTGSVGVAYEDEVWSRIMETGREYRSAQMTYKFGVGANAEGYLKTQVALKFYRVAGPYVGLASGLGFSAEVLQPPQIDWELYWALRGSAGGEVKILGRRLLNFSLDLFEEQFTILEGKAGAGQQSPDSDGDGVPDDKDGCPADPNKTAPGQCGCGKLETPGCGASQAPAVPFSPRPDDGAAGVSLEADLDWGDAARATSYNVYFGATNPPPLVGDTALSDWALSTLSYETTYYWRIVAGNSAGGTPGPLWSFTTQPEPVRPPDAPSSPTPANGATGVSIDADLDWGDAARATSYNVYFGPTNPPPLVANTPSSDWALSTLSYETTYYWQIVASNSVGHTPGPVWSFTTQREDQRNPAISDVRPNPVIGSWSPSNMTIDGSNFVQGAKITWRDITHGQTYPDRDATWVSSTRLTATPTFGPYTARWSAQVVNPGGASSNQFEFQVQAPNPFISGVDPNPVPGYNGPQMLRVLGSDFAAGCIVRLYDLTNEPHGPFDKPTTFISSKEVRIQANFTNSTARWTAQVINPDQRASNVFEFRVERR